MGNWNSTVDKECNLLVLGEKGVGKTSFLKALGEKVYETEKLTLNTIHGPITFNIKGCKDLTNVIEDYSKANIVMVMYTKNFGNTNREVTLSRYRSAVQKVNKNENIIFISCSVDKNNKSLDIDTHELIFDEYVEHFAIGNGPLISHILPIFTFLAQKMMGDDENELVFS